MDLIDSLKGADTLIGVKRLCGACVERPLNVFGYDVGGEKIAD